MPQNEKDKAVATPIIKQKVKDALGFVETHSQDADRHRGVKHPVSDK